MSKVVSLIVFGWLFLSIFSGIHGANAKEPTGRPLAATATVINACILAIVRSIPEKSVDLASSAVMITSKLIGVRCRNGSLWRVAVDRGPAESLLKRVVHTPSGSGATIRVSINF
jgi:hypothetical protein